MYNYIFWIIYNRNINRDKSEWLSRNNASGVVFFAIFIHIAFLFVVIDKLLKFRHTTNFISSNKGLVFIIILLFMLFTFLYYNKERITAIERKYSNREGLTQYGGLIVASLIFVPLLFIIILLS